MPHPATRLPSPELTLKPTKRIVPLLLLALALSVVGLWLFAWLAEEVFEGDMSRFDRIVRSTIHNFASPGLTSWMKATSFFGSVIFLASASVALCLLFVIIRWRRAAAWLAIDMIGAAVLDATLKNVFHRARPQSFFGVEPHTFSFPSGHALASLCFYCVLAGLLASRVTARPLGALFWTAAVVIAAAIGFSRIYLGVHYPSDVIAGYLAALVWVGALLSIDRWRGGPRPRPTYRR